jgi:hypothetical protein
MVIYSRQTALIIGVSSINSKAVPDEATSTIANISAGSAYTAAATIYYEQIVLHIFS